VGLCESGEVMFDIKVIGLDKLRQSLNQIVKDLEKVPENFSKRVDVQGQVEALAKMSLDQMVVSSSGHTSYENIKAEAFATEGGRKGIVVFEALNEDTRSKAGNFAGLDPYILFFLEEYAPSSFLKDKSPRDFLKLWPDLMKPVVVEAFNQEVDKVLGK
jgi:hypothetical protein